MTSVRPSSTTSDEEHFRVSEVERPTTEFDLERTPRFNPANNAATAFARYAGQPDSDRLAALRKERITQWAEADRPGFSLIDRALASASPTLAQAGLPGRGIFSWTRAEGPTLPTPQTLGLDPYAASPEETAGVVKAAARFFGAALVGVTSLQHQWVLSHCRGKPVTIEETELPKETDEGYTIPERCRWVISCAVELSRAASQRSPSAIGEAAAGHANSRAALVVASLAQFIRALGYTAIPSRADILLEVPFAIAAGLGELGRLNLLVTPDFGPGVRTYSVITDLPMAPDKPVDFGLQDFCRRCRICAEACPARAIDFEDGPSWEPKGPWNNPGKQAWFLAAPKCQSYRQQVTTNCAVCIAACPWPRHGDSPAEPSFQRKDNRAEMQREWWKDHSSTFGL